MVDVTIYQGEDLTIRVMVLDDTNTAKDISDFTISFSIGDTRGGTVIFAKAGSFVTDGVDGLMEVGITGDESIDFAFRTWDFAFWLTDNQGATQVSKEGIIDVKKLVRQP